MGYIYDDEDNAPMNEDAWNAQRKKPAKPEMEGGGWNWYYVCEECHGIIDTKHKTCPHCQTPIDWSDMLWNRGKVDP